MYSALLNQASASNYGVEKNKKYIKFDITPSDKKPTLQVIYLWTTCPNGVRRTVGNIGLTDGGQVIGYMYWGETMACENDQVAYYVVE